MAWDKTTPASTDDIRQGDNVLREMKEAVASALTANGRFPIDASSPKFQYKGGKGDTASRPSNGSGGMYYDTDTAELLRDNGSSWEQIGVNLVSGTICVFYQATAPTGWTITGISGDYLLYTFITPGSTPSIFTDFTTGVSSSLNHTHNIGTAVINSGGFAKGIKLWADTFGSGDSFTIGESSTLTYQSGTNDFTGPVNGSASNGDLFVTDVSSSWDSHTHTGTHSLSEHATIRVIGCQKD